MNYRILWRDCDGNGYLKASALSALFQELLLKTLADCGRPFNPMKEGGRYAWMVVRLDYSLNRPFQFNEMIQIELLRYRPRTMLLPLTFSIYANGQKIGSAVELWVMNDREKRIPVKLSQIPELSNAPPSGKMIENELLLPEGEFKIIYATQVRASYCDPNGHLNSGRCLDLVTDVFECNKQALNVEMQWMKEGQRNDRIELYTKDNQNESYVMGVNQLGEPLFKAVIAK